MCWIQPFWLSVIEMMQINHIDIEKFIIPEAGRRILALQEAADLRENSVNSMKSRVEPKLSGVMQCFICYVNQKTIITES